MSHGSRGAICLRSAVETEVPSPQPTSSLRDKPPSLWDRVEADMHARRLHRRFLMRTMRLYDLIDSSRRQ